MHLPCSSFSIALTGEGGRHSDNGNSGGGPNNVASRCVGRVGGNHLRATSSMMRVLERRAVSLTLGAFVSMVYDDGNNNNGRRRGGGGSSMRQRQRRRKAPIVPPCHPTVSGADGRVPFMSEAQSDEILIGVPPHRSGHGIRGGGRRRTRGSSVS